MAAAGAAGASTFLERVIHAGSQSGESRSQPADEAGEHGEHDREQGNLPVEADFIDARQRLR